MNIRFFLVAPDTIHEAHLLACATAACAAAPCASIVIADTTSAEAVQQLQSLNLAVILKDSDASKVHALKADGLLLSSLEQFKAARDALSNESLGLIAGVSRHDAMDAAELGADFVCFTPTKQYAGEPIIGWWQDVTDVPAVAYDAVEDTTLKAQRPDFIRPSDAMWSSPDSATSTLQTLAAQWV